MAVPESEFEIDVTGHSHLHEVVVESNAQMDFIMLCEQLSCGAGQFGEDGLLLMRAAGLLQTTLQLVIVRVVPGITVLTICS